ncbi:MAG TPA: Stp1/IreP family PP2C-type Ser/Thr phosphatase [Gammaproteobacteria bacterium]|nr:Stp1/IreP family PP2C-type Ser/Thr phosphatase [Gammaproteobacteria bacterium]
MSPHYKLEISAVTDPGVKRANNEDSIGMEASLGLAVVADGMGGYEGGEVASALAVQTILNELSERIELLRKQHAEADSGEYSIQSLAVRDVIKKSNEIIYNAARNEPQYQGMGTTVVLALFYDNRLTIAHVGDSRLYRLRDDRLELITVDHTLMQQLIQRGFYTAQEARESLNKNLVIRALGTDPEVEVDIQEDIALPGDIYLLCSDGLNDMIDDGEIYLTLKRYNDNLDLAATELVKQANKKGGKDNVSVILARPVKTGSATLGWIEKVTDWFF